jgi:hypothetical protein
MKRAEQWFWLMVLAAPVAALLAFFGLFACSVLFLPGR